MSVISVTGFGHQNVSVDSDSEDDAMGDIEATGFKSSIVTPGERITDDPTWMRGHGTFYLSNQTYSSVAGSISRVSKLLSVIPFHGRYSPETGDHVVGRIVEVSQKRWKVDIGAQHDAILMLGSVNLPGGVLRRKSESDELQMRSFLKEGDLLNAEVQTVSQDGAAFLHTRSLKYGKLRNGVFVRVPSSLIVRAKNHSHDLPGSVSVILGVNGFVWIYRTKVNANTKTENSASINRVSAQLSSSRDYTPGQGSESITRLEEESSWSIYSDQNDEDFPETIKLNITRYRGCILALAHCEIGITGSRLVNAYHASMVYDNIDALVSNQVKEAIGRDIIEAEKMRGK
ncbi:unnamed protein product [Kuraishia capsulata CBS 1993]|uniref:Uncharacterized protein n=1 Tax=Kuraishia capsulata CBS 1993 TaxID=1382522 RepID=W6MTA2_9ASCO|nr:uncharacterized protein KUCA_T00005958001 [Kuraishia capsulata CBS 1993]CDK29964.1 unnamed protein product [Kuraishia capsulata CBS 1993]